MGRGRSRKQIPNGFAVAVFRDIEGTFLDLQRRLDEILDAVFADDVLASELGPDGVWRRVPMVRGLEAQAELIRLATERARGER